MDRKNYLEICQRNSVSEDKVTVEYNSLRYIPTGLLLWFNNSGETKNTAVLKSMIAPSYLHCDLENVKT